MFIVGVAFVVEPSNEANYFFSIGFLTQFFSGNIIPSSVKLTKCGSHMNDFVYFHQSGFIRL